LRGEGEREGRLERAALVLGCMGLAGLFPTSICAGVFGASSAGTFGGSLDLTSDYFVRGISRTNDQAALQLSLYYLTSPGFVAGVFASNSQITPNEPRDAELSAYLGVVRPIGDWQAKIVVSDYSYPWNELGSKYNYAEIDAEAVFRGWLDITLSYSPNFPRYRESSGGLVGASAESAEVNVQRPVFKKLSATGGVGYFYFSGYDSAGYVYFSLGASYDLAPVTLAVSYVDTSAQANALFYNAAHGGKWTGTILWRF
jgi:uncharacterized protein (TIGR02001 family)